VSFKHIPLLVCALVALTVTAIAGAQFTAAVVPPRAKAKVDTTLKQDSVRRATVALAILSRHACDTEQATGPRRRQ